MKRSASYPRQLRFAARSGLVAPDDTLNIRDVGVLKALEDAKATTGSQSILDVSADAFNSRAVTTSGTSVKAVEAAETSGKRPR